MNASHPTWTRPLLHTLLAFALIMGGSAWGASEAMATEGEAGGEASETKAEGRVVSRRVVSRRVVKRTVVEKGKKKKSKKKRGRRVRLVVDPSAAEQADAPATSAPPALRSTANAPRLTASTAAPATTRTTASTTTARRAPIASQGLDEQLVVEPELEPGERGGSVRVEAVTDAPLHVGAGVLLESRSRLRLMSSAGFMPSGYLALSNSLVQRVDDSYPEEAATLVNNAMKRSFAWRTQVGVRPFRRAGFYVHGGYTLLTLSGETSGEELVATAAALDESQGELMRQMNPERVALASKLHMLNAELGWDFELGERANLRLGAGWAYTAYSKTKVDATFGEESRMSAEDEAFFEEVSGKYLDAIYRTFVHPPTLSMAFGVRF